MVLYDSFQYYKQYNLIKRKRRITNKKKTFKLEISDLMVAILMQGCVIYTFAMPNFFFGSIPASTIKGLKRE